MKLRTIPAVMDVICERLGAHCRLRRLYNAFAFITGRSIPNVWKNCLVSTVFFTSTSLPVPLLGILDLTLAPGSRDLKSNQVILSSITRGVVTQSPEPEAHVLCVRAFRVELEFRSAGF